MAGETKITVIGNLTADPELRFTPNGAAVANFTIASTPRNYDKQSGEWKEGETLFLRASVWQAAAENVAQSLRKGMRVIAQGNLKTRQYETKEGERRTSTELEVEEIGPSLRFASAQVTRNQQNNNSNGGGNWGGNNGYQGNNGFQQQGNQGNFQGNGAPAAQQPQGGFSQPNQQSNSQQNTAPQNNGAVDPWASADPGTYNWGAGDDEPPF